MEIGVSIAMGIAQARWMVYFMENPNIKWMMYWGTPISRNLQIARLTLHLSTAACWTIPPLP
jgi:hypothetical protein